MGRGDSEQKLFKLIKEIKEQNVNWIMSNSDTKLVIDNFNESPGQKERLVVEKAGLASPEQFT